jgi:Tfp pilus assembly protein PilN
MRAVNLLGTREPRRAKRPSGAAIVAIAGSVVLALAVTVVMVMTGKQESAKRDRLDQQKIELALIPRPAAQSSVDSTGLGAAQAPRVQAVSTALSNRVAWERILRRFALVVPRDVWLSSLTLGSPTASTDDAAATSAQGFSIAGYTYSHDSVARLLSRLELVPDLADVQLQTSTVAELGGRRVVQFSIIAGLSPGAAS